MEQYLLMQSIGWWKMKNKKELGEAILNNGDKYLKFKKKCECGHSLMILNREGILPCRWCGRLVFLSKKVEFKYKMKNKLKEANIKN